jgi:hypothetical protein
MHGGTHAALLLWEGHAMFFKDRLMSGDSYGIPLGGAALTREQASALVAKGYRVLFTGFDVLMLKDQVASFASRG